MPVESHHYLQKQTMMPFAVLSQRINSARPYRCLNWIERLKWCEWYWSATYEVLRRSNMWYEMKDTATADICTTII